MRSPYCPRLGATAGMSITRWRNEGESVADADFPYSVAISVPMAFAHDPANGLFHDNRRWVIVDRRRWGRVDRATGQSTSDQGTPDQSAGNPGCNLTVLRSGRADAPHQQAHCQRPRSWLAYCAPQSHLRSPNEATAVCRPGLEVADPLLLGFDLNN